MIAAILRSLESLIVKDQKNQNIISLIHSRQSMGTVVIFASFETYSSFKIKFYLYDLYIVSSLPYGSV